MGSPGSRTQPSPFHHPLDTLQASANKTQRLSGQVPILAQPMLGTRYAIPQVHFLLRVRTSSFKGATRRLQALLWHVTGEPDAFVRVYDCRPAASYQVTDFSRHGLRKTRHREPRCRGIHQHSARCGGISTGPTGTQRGIEVNPRLRQLFNVYLSQSSLAENINIRNDFEERDSARALHAKEDVCIQKDEAPRTVNEECGSDQR
ncbi:hypothetical protein DENSPDRAFT_846153 [Dentipellis sp. KUC8613]|nr:hypothetical protein DENSPDRAFT_846153 [Dentipellis sp. KUC8613]